MHRIVSCLMLTAALAGCDAATEPTAPPLATPDPRSTCRGAQSRRECLVRRPAPGGPQLDQSVTGDSGTTSSLSQQVTVTGSLTGRAESTPLSLFDLVSRVPG